MNVEITPETVHALLVVWAAIAALTVADVLVHATRRRKP